MSNLDDVCRFLVAKKFETKAKISIRKIDERIIESRSSFGEIHVDFEKNGVLHTCTFHAKYPQNFRENVMEVKLFRNSHSKEKLTLAILKDIDAVLRVSFTPDIWYLSEKLVIYDVDTKFQHAIFYNENHILIGLSILAKFHACSIAYLDPNTKNKRFDIESIEEFKEDPFDEEIFRKMGVSIGQHLQETRKIFKDTFLDDITSRQVRIELENLREKLKHLRLLKKVLINGNYSCENLLFDMENSDCRMAEFSHVAFHSPLFDVFQFVVSISNSKDWENNANDALTLYYANLDRELQKFDLNINQTFPLEEYEKTRDILTPFMKLIFYLKMMVKEENHRATLTPDSSASNLLEVLGILNLIEITKQDISFEDCYSVSKQLSTDEICKLKSFETKTLPVRNGFLGEHFSLEIELSSKFSENSIATFPLFLKSVPRSEALKEFSDSVGSFFKETMFYKKYVPLLKQHNIHLLDGTVPKCYFADEHKYIVLDNLTNLGYVTLSPRHKLTNELIVKVIEKLAKFNSTCIILEELIKRKTGNENFTLPSSAINFSRDEFKEPFYSMVPVVERHRNSGRGGMKALVELIEFDDTDENSADFAELALRACDQQVNYAKPSERWRNTICHADFWTKNFMVRYSKDSKVEDVMMLDFQTYRYAPPAQDLMAFVYLNTAEETRKGNFDTWLQLYYRTFANCLREYDVKVENILSEGDFRESCEYYRQFAINQSITHFQVILSPGEIIDPMLLDPKETENIFFGSRYDLVRKIWNLDEDYRARLTEAVSLLRKCLLSKNENRNDV